MRPNDFRPARAMPPSRVHRVATVGLVCAVSIAADVRADDTTPLSKAEVESLVVGRTVPYVRKRDGTTVTWDFRNGGDVYYTTPNTSRNTSFSGTYTIEDDGSLCFKWRADKYLAMQDGCVKFVREGATTHVVGQRNPGNVLGDVVP